MEPLAPLVRIVVNKAKTPGCSSGCKSRANPFGFGARLVAQGKKFWCPVT